MNWIIDDSEIHEIERLLLPQGCHFSDDALKVIRHWESIDVSACPGSGKTTVLLAKLKLLTDRMPLENGAGVCVLSHTNVAVNEIKKKLPGCAEKLINYPNYVGTIQSFIDRFITLPYIRQKFGRSIQVVNAKTYSQQMLNKLKNNQYSALQYILKKNYAISGNEIYSNQVEHTMALYLSDTGDLHIRNQKMKLAGADTKSTNQFNKLKEDLLKDEGIITYDDAFRYAERAIEELPQKYKDLFSARFKYIYIDEYQDCSELQKATLLKLFDRSKCAVTHIGDPDQAIYNGVEDKTIDWHPIAETLTITMSCRYKQNIANVLSPLKKDNMIIRSSLEGDGFKPVLIIYELESIKNVLNTFVSLLEERGLHDSNGTYKAIGFIGKKDSKGISISSYWDEFDNTKKSQKLSKYWEYIDEVCYQLKQGNLYIVEYLVRKLMCLLFHYAKLKDVKTGKPHTIVSIRVILKEKYNVFYSDCILNLSKIPNYTINYIDNEIRHIINKIFREEKHTIEDIYDFIPDYFMEEPIKAQKISEEKNIFVEPTRERRIQFDTVHGVKGETHDATLYLETQYKNGSDIGRVLCYYGVGKVGSSTLYNYSRKIVYVGMSRPKMLLCVAIQALTYSKSKDAFCEWDIIDLRSTTL